MSFAIVFVCHDNNSIESVLNYNYYILFVGNREIDENYKNNPKIIIARDLSNNIEHE